MKLLKTKFKGLFIVKQQNNIDKRGSLRETYNKKKIKKNKFVFEYCTISKKNSLRKNSKTFGKTFKIILSEKNCLSLYIPEGFAHAYFSYDKLNVVYYKLNNYYKPNFESGINLMDKKLKISWPSKNYEISKKDKKLQNFQQFCKNYKFL